MGGNGNLFVVVAIKRTKLSIYIKLTKMKKESNTTEQQCNKQIVNNRFCAGAIWHRYNGENLIEKVIEKEWSKTKVRMTSGQVFSKIFLSKYYRCVGNGC